MAMMRASLPKNYKRTSKKGRKPPTLKFKKEKVKIIMKEYKQDKRKRYKRYMA